MTEAEKVEDDEQAFKEVLKKMLRTPPKPHAEKKPSEPSKPDATRDAQ